MDRYLPVMSKRFALIKRQMLNYSYKYEKFLKYIFISILIFLSSELIYNIIMLSVIKYYNINIIDVRPGIYQWYDPNVQAKLIIYTLSFCFMSMNALFLIKYANKNWMLYYLAAIIISKYEFNIKSSLEHIIYPIVQIFVLYFFIKNRKIFWINLNLNFLIIKKILICLISITLLTYLIYFFIIIFNYPKISNEFINIEPLKTSDVSMAKGLEFTIPKNCIAHNNQIKLNEKIDNINRIIDEKFLKINSSTKYIDKGNFFISGDYICYVGEYNYFYKLSEEISVDQFKEIRQLGNQLSVVPGDYSSSHFLLSGRGFFHHWLRVFLPYSLIFNSNNSFTNTYNQYGIVYLFVPYVFSFFSASGFYPTLGFFYSTYILFAALLSFSFWILFRSKLYAIGSAAMGLFVFSNYTDLGIKSIPGYLPLRYFLLPLFFIVLLKSNFFKSKKYIKNLFLLCLFSFLFSREYGLIFSLALFATFTIFTILKIAECKFRPIYILFPLAAVLVYLFLSGPDNSGSSFFSGIHSISIPYEHMVNYIRLIALFSILSFAVYVFNYKYLAVYIFGMIVYSSSIFYHFIIYTPDHINTYYVFLIPIFFILLHTFGRVLSKIEIRYRVVCYPIYYIAISFAIIFLSISGASNLYFEYSRALKNFNLSTSYFWSDNKINALVNFNPSIFNSSATLIEENIPSNKILIVSIYADLLYYLTNKVPPSSLVDLNNDITENKQFHMISSNFTDDYIVVDNQYKSFLCNSIIIDSKYSAYLHNESYWNYQRRLSLAKFIDETIKSNYSIYRSNSLISIYKKNS